jgi:6,7-dimethyl-8-ribityllumazine synthase
VSIFISGGGGAGGGATNLNGLGDVTITSAANGQILKYNSVSGVWENTGLNVTGGLIYKGSLDASQAATPDISNAEQGDFYIISVAGTIYGQSWNVGDHLLVNEDMGGSVTNSKIDKIDNTDAVASVNGATGVVNLYADDATLNLAGDGLTISGAGATSTLTVDDASTTAAGKVELADNTEAAAASATDRALTPANIPSIETADLNNTAGFISGITNESLNDLNDVSYTAGAGIDNYVLTSDHSTTSWGAEAAAGGSPASTTVAGIVELADNTEAAAASATDRALTPSNIGSIDTSDLNNDAGFIANITNESLNDLNDVSYTAGVGIDNYVLTYDHSTTSWGAEAAPTAAAASTTVAGIVELADNTEAAAASATDKALTPSNIGSIDTSDLNNDAGFISGITNESLNDLNDVSYTAGAGIDNYVLTYDHSTTSWGAEAAPTAGAASTTTAGIVELADNTEAAAASATDRALTPSNIPSIETGDLNNTAGFISGITGESLNDLSDVSYTAGAGIDNYVLTYDHSTSSWGAEAAGGAGTRPTVTTDNSGTNTTITDPAASVLEGIFLIDNGSTAVTITLPTVTNNAGYKAQIKRLGTASVTVSPASGTIDGASSKVINAQYGALTCCTDGTNWFII